MNSRLEDLLIASGNGDAAASEELFSRVYGELKKIAHHQLAACNGATLNTTALVHEAYLKLGLDRGRLVQGRMHLFALSAKAMRQIVIDHARARLAQKRGGADLRLVALDEAEDIAEGELDSDQLVRLGEALAAMEIEEPRLAQLVDLRFFAGLGLEEIAALTDTSPRTLSRDWRRARAQLYEALNPS